MDQITKKRGRRPKNSVVAESFLQKSLDRSVLSGVISVEVDKDAFKKSCFGILEISEEWKVVKALPKISFSALPTYYKEVIHAVEVATAAVEVAKSEVLKNYPEGTKFSTKIALETAVDIFDNAIKFNGSVGRILDSCDQAFLKLLINVIFSKNAGTNWLSDAVSILKLLVASV